MSDAETRTHSALHVLKGAAQKVLGTNLTTSVYVSGGRGRLTVQSVRKPTQEEMRRVEQEA
ncbi:MAG TPA: alanyl-tRNA editing protein, partial [Nitrososphaerales archaeon]|nr:alanyl-tRNA editing protein [Nitrososphaerales archaeon]